MTTINISKYLSLGLVFLLCTFCTVTGSGYEEIQQKSKYSMEKAIEYQKVRQDLSYPSGLSGVGVFLDSSSKIYQTILNIDYQKGMNEIKDESMKCGRLFVLSWWWENGCIDRDAGASYDFSRYDSESPPSSLITDPPTLETPEYGYLPSYGPTIYGLLTLEKKNARNSGIILGMSSVGCKERVKAYTIGYFDINKNLDLDQDEVLGAIDEWYEDQLKFYELEIVLELWGTPFTSQEYAIVDTTHSPTGTTTTSTTTTIPSDQSSKDQLRESLRLRVMPNDDNARPNYILGKWKGSHDQYSYGSYPMVMDISRIEGNNFYGTLHWPTLRDSITTCEGHIEGDTLQWTEPQLLQGSNILLNGIFEARFISEDELVGNWYRPDNGLEDSQFKLKRVNEAYPSQEYLLGTWAGTHDQYSYGIYSSYPMIMDISRIEGNNFYGTLHWPTLRDSITTCEGYIEGDTLQWTEPQLLQGSNILLNGIFEARFISEDELVGNWYRPDNGIEGSRFNIKHE